MAFRTFEVLHLLLGILVLKARSGELFIVPSFRRAPNAGCALFDTMMALPINAFRTEILESISRVRMFCLQHTCLPRTVQYRYSTQNTVTIVKGDTGSGKSSQIPQVRGCRPCHSTEVPHPSPQIVFEASQLAHAASKGELATAAAAAAAVVGG